MRIRKLHLNLPYWNKGIVFTIDVVLGFTILLITLSLANYYVNRINVDAFSELQIRRTGSDIIALLDYFNYLNPPGTQNINQKLSEILPSYYNINLEGIGSNNCVFSAGSPVPSNLTILSGSRFFVITTNPPDYCLIRYKIWQN
ncbi:hypothetical protein HYX16_05025 [Candidatus Woesearchaeota archaeon]|nr:hypothetical protein [Candidatus Woesearchaeota archaeon]